MSKLKKFSPMLAAPADMSLIKFPLIVSAKLDGIRCCIVDGQALTRSLKPIPNKFIREALSKPVFDGLDGELILGDPTAVDCYLKTNSAVMSHGGEPEVSFYVFDKHDMDDSFGHRQSKAHMQVIFADDINHRGPIKLIAHEQKYVDSFEEIDAAEELALAKGYEGLILRDYEARYKYGRSTAKEGGMLKLKRFEDDEAVIEDVYEEMHNENEAFTNELGRTARSTAQAGMTGKGTAGGITVRHATYGVFNLGWGKGWTHAKRKALWDSRADYIGKIAKFEFFKIGMKQGGAPRHPRFLDVRSPLDLDVDTGVD